MIEFLLKVSVFCCKKDFVMIKLFNYAINIGEQMLISGAEVHRVEESITRMCRAFGAVRTDVFIITSSMVVTIHTPNGETYTQTRRVMNSSSNFEKLHLLNDLSRKICQKGITEQEIEEKFNEAIHCKKNSVLSEFVSFAVIACAFTLFFGGNLTEAAISFFVGAIVRLGIYFCSKVTKSKIFDKFLAATIATSLAFVAVKIGWISSVDMIIIGNIMSLIPGIGLTNALRDLFTGDSISGLLRLIEAALIALSIAAGYFLVAFLGGFAL